MVFRISPRRSQSRFLEAVATTFGGLLGGDQVHEKPWKRCQLLPPVVAEISHRSGDHVERERREEASEQHEKDETSTEPLYLIKNTFVHVPIPSPLVSQPSSGAYTVA